MSAIAISISTTWIEEDIYFDDLFTALGAIEGINIISNEKHGVSMFSLKRIIKPTQMEEFLQEFYDAFFLETAQYAKFGKKFDIRLNIEFLNNAEDEEN